MKIATDRELKSWKKTKAVGGVKGLTLRVNASGGKSFVLRISLGGIRKEVYVCSFDKGVAFARKKADELRMELEGNPFYEDTIKKAIKKRERAKKAMLYTVEDLVLDYIESESKRGRWSLSGRQPHPVKFKSLVQNHFSESLKTLPAIQLTPEIIATEFGEKWTNMSNTPDKAIGEIKRAWTWGIAMKKIPTLANPAETSILKHLLAASSRRPKKTHYPYLEPEDVPEFVRELTSRAGSSPSCLMFTILTCSRISSVLNLTWKQIDLKKKTMTIPREQMKVKMLSFDRVTPLSKQAIDILKSIPSGDQNEPVFYNWQKMSRDALSETSLAKVIRRINSDRIANKQPALLDPTEVDNEGNRRSPTPHGLARASFKTWANSAKRYKHKVFERDFVEACLDHLSDRYGGAYMREYPIEDMREILQAWSDYCYGSRPTR